MGHGWPSVGWKLVQAEDAGWIELPARELCLADAEELVGPVFAPEGLEIPARLRATIHWATHADVRQGPCVVAVSLSTSVDGQGGAWSEIRRNGRSWVFGLGCCFVGSLQVWPIVTSTTRGEDLVHTSDANGWAIIHDNQGGMLAFRVWVQHPDGRVWVRGAEGVLSGILIDLDLIEGLQPSALGL